MKQKRLQLKVKLKFFFLLIVSLAFSVYADQEVYRVQSGDTLWSISRSFHIPIQDIAKKNHLQNSSKLKVGQELLIPLNESKKEINWNAENDLRELTLVSGGKLARWRYVVIHHSATPNGNAKAFDYFHRTKRHMKNGLAYHFVIGNGQGSGDGQIEVGSRWVKQLPGGHCSNQQMNQVGLGICLVGNFEKTDPTPKQMEALAALVTQLQKICRIPNSRVITHRQVKQKSTLCPGEQFSIKRLRQML